MFSRPSVIFLGHVLSADRISANPEKIDKVKNWPVPKNIKELHSVHGLASYYHQFIPNFACMAKCLHQLIGPTNVKKNKDKKKEETTFGPPEETKPIYLDVRHQRVFDSLKTSLTKVPVSDYPNFSKEFIFKTDASLKGWGAVLLFQEENPHCSLCGLGIKTI